MMLLLLGLLGSFLCVLLYLGDGLLDAFCFLFLGTTAGLTHG